jgi:uncharacterized surface protein with fasciclin (FAS1) repeats
MEKKIFSFVLLTAIAVTMMVACNNSTETFHPKIEDTSKTVAEQPMTAKEEEGVVVGNAKMVPSKNILENLAGSNVQTILVTAIQAAGLDETLNGDGPFTVFAPTNAAFDKLSEGTFEELLKAEKKADLDRILTFHVVPGSIMVSDLKDGQKLKTVQGQELTIAINDGAVTINGVAVTIADIVSSNGVMHVIDGVLLPQ